MSKKYLIVGGVAGGASTAARLRRLGEDDQIIMFEKGPHVSFSNCSLPYHLSGQVPKVESLVMMNPEVFLKQYNIDARVNNEVLSIDRKNKTVQVKNLVSGEVYTENYDKLILSPGAKAIIPNIPGIEKVNTFIVKNVVDIDKLNKFIKANNPKRISVIGGGFIGIECVENLVEDGQNVTLIEAKDQILPELDYGLVQILHKELLDKGVELIVNDMVVGFDTNKIILNSGKSVDSEVIILSIGVSPETKLAKDSGLEIGKTGAIKVDQNFKTNDTDIYAVGDVIEVYNPLMQNYFKLPLAGPAQKQARSAADHIHNKPISNIGYIGSSVVKVFDYNSASTGLNRKTLDTMNIKYEFVHIIPKDKVGLIPGAEEMHFKLFFEIPTGKILGAQAIGKGNVEKRIDVIATAIKFNANINDLRDLELCYAPPFGTAKDVVNFAGYVASNLLHDSFKQVATNQVRNLLKDDNAVIIDVREKSEYDLSHIIGVNNIPLSEIRNRLDEIPKDKSIYLHCRSGQRSYNAVLILQANGFESVFNVSGGFMGISYYEYFNDVMTGRDKIVTDYNFL